MKRKPQDSKNLKLRYIFLGGISLRILFSLFGHNVDWLNTVKLMNFTFNGIDSYSQMNYPYFPTRFYVDYLVFYVNNLYEFPDYKFINFERLIFVLGYFTVQSLIILYAKNELPKRLINYFNYSLVLSFISGFANQLDSFVLVVLISLLYKVDKTNNKKDLFFSGFLFLLFMSMKPIILLIYVPIALIYRTKENFIYFIFGNSLSLVLNYIVCFQTSILGVKFDLSNVLSGVLRYKGFDNAPLLTLLNINFSYRFGDILSARNFLIVCFLVFLAIKLFKLKEINIDFVIFYFLIYTFIFAPQLAQQNLALLFVALSLFKIVDIKNKLLILEIFTILYLILLNLVFVSVGVISNVNYLLYKIYYFLESFGLVYIPKETYFGNFILLAIVYLTYFELFNKLKKN